MLQKSDIFFWKSIGTGDYLRLLLLIKVWNKMYCTVIRIILNDGITAIASIQMIGSLNTSSKTWMWAWDNPSVNDCLKQDSLKLKYYDEEHHIDKLIEGIWEGTETEGWEMKKPH